MWHAYILFAILIITLVLFIWGRWRYDIVALFSLILAVLTGVVPFDKAFLGFSNSAVITVACVMAITYAITESGILDYVIDKIIVLMKTPLLYISALTLLTAFLSAFMNNVGALVLMMPIAIRTSIKTARSPSIILMPLAFGSVLGGLVTAIGTPPNLLISAYRQQITGQPFAMFDFTPVGLIVALTGIIFIILIGWRLLPERKPPSDSEEIFQIEDYITEVKVTENSPIIGITLKELEKLIDGEYIVIGMIRKRKKKLVVPRDEILKKNDILIIEGDHQSLKLLIKKGKLELVTGKNIDSNILRSDEISLIEAVVPQGSRVDGRSSQNMRLRSRYNLNLIAISRQGNPFKNRLNQVNLRAGDIVMLQGNVETLKEDIVSLGFLPLIERDVQIGVTRKAFLPILIFMAAILFATFQILPVQIAFIIAVFLLVILNILPARKLYETINWPIIILLGALIPVGQALETTGAAQLLGNLIQSLNNFFPPIFIIGLLFFFTMTLSDIMNNAATAVVMAPIAIAIAKSMHANVDPFLMTVAISASCSFLTPIGHQNNTLVMGPGGYKFYDYLRMGIPLEIIIIIVAVPLIMWVWPLH